MSKAEWEALPAEAKLTARQEQAALDKARSEERRAAYEAREREAQAQEANITGPGERASWHPCEYSMEGNVLHIGRMATTGYLPVRADPRPSDNPCRYEN